jgi:hypothetical protein
MKRLTYLAVCLIALALLAGCSADPYYRMTYPGAKFDPGSQ